MDASLRVLMIEGSDRDAEFAEAHIRRAGLICEIERTNTATNLGQILQYVRPDVIMCALKMPGASGLDVLKSCRHFGHEAPFILVSYFPRAFEVSAAKALGAMALLDKTAYGQLLVVLRNALNIALVRSLHQAYRAIA
jgi:DNA-binding NtrC family response regulator